MSRIDEILKIWAKKGKYVRLCGVWTKKSKFVRSDYFVICPTNLLIESSTKNGSGMTSRIGHISFQF